MLPLIDQLPFCPDCGKQLEYAWKSPDDKDDGGLYCYNCHKWVSDEEMFDEHFEDDADMEYKNGEVLALRKKKL